MELYGLSKIVGWKGWGLPTPDYTPQPFVLSRGGTWVSFKILHFNRKLHRFVESGRKTKLITQNLFKCSEKLLTKGFGKLCWTITGIIAFSSICYQTFGFHLTMEEVLLHIQTIPFTLFFILSLWLQNMVYAFSHKDIWVPSFPRQTFTNIQALLGLDVVSRILSVVL